MAANTVYLIKSASFEPDKVYYKIGFTSNLRNRLLNYTTDNPSYMLLQTVEVYDKTKRHLEAELHNEIKQYGFKFQAKTIFNRDVITEWFEVKTDSEFYKMIENEGLAIFNNCKQRKSIKWYNR